MNASDAQIAQVLEDAADFILVRGLVRGELCDPFDRYCTIGAIYRVVPFEEGSVTVAGDACETFEQYLRAQGVPLPEWDEAAMHPVAIWSDNSTDDFEVIDALRHCAKGIRNTATA